ALEHEPDGGFWRTVLMEMYRRRTRAQIGSVVLTGNRVHGILAQETLLRGELYGLARGLLEEELIQPRRAINVKKNATGVLADGLRFVFCQLDVLLDDLQR